jgi:hypothetical protein
MKGHTAFYASPYFQGLIYVHVRLIERIVFRCYSSQE